MRRVAFLILAVCASAALAADKREARAVGAFSGVALAVPAKLEIVQGDTESLTLEGPAEALADIETVVRGDGVLAIRKRTGGGDWVLRGTDVRIVANMKRVESLAIAGSGDIGARALRGPKLTLVISGSGNMALPAIDTDEAKVSINGSGDVRVAGRAAALSSSIAGSGNLRADKLETRKASLHIAGAGDAALWVRDSLQVRIAGSGDVRYYGDPSIEKRVVGSGSVKRLGPSPS